MKRVIKETDFVNFSLVTCRDELFSQLPQEVKCKIRSHLFSFQCSRGSNGCKAFLFESSGMFWGCKCTIRIYDNDT